jgi:Fe-S cluster assembly protein SufD
MAVTANLLSACRAEDRAGEAAAWMRERRARARSRFEADGLPGPRDELWRYTPLKPLERLRIAAPAESFALDAWRIGELATPGLEHSRLVFVDGRLQPALSTPRAADGVRVDSLRRVLESDPKRLQPWLGALADDQASGFAALNAAFHSDGAVVELERNASVDGAVELLFLSTSGESAPLSHPRVLVIAGEGSRARIIERYAALDDGPSLSTPVTEIHIGAAARIDHYRVQRASSAAFQFASLHASLARDAVYRNHNFALGGALARLDLDVAIEGSGANCELFGLYHVDGRRHVDNHTRVRHRVPHGSSRQLYKGILDQRGRGVFRGRVVVSEGAHGTDAQQTCNNLVLSAHAEADVLPQLEIYNDDVKCSHGATVGRLDDDSLFYLRSRGIDLDRARALLTWAFAAEVLTRVDEPHVRREVEQALAGGLLPADAVELLT